MTDSASARPPKKGDHIFLVDGSGYIFRAYHALPPLTRSDGLPTGAVSGFCNMLYKLIADTKDEYEPTHLAVIFDAAAKTFRNEIYPEYKANRPPAPEDLVPQFALIRDAVRAFDVPCIEMKNYEADDIIATYTRLAREAGARVTIVSSDKDLMQLVSDEVDLLDTMKMKTIDADAVMERFGVTPDKVVDVQALAGDSTDNVPGVPGIGVKTAAQLINEYGDLETLLAEADGIKQKKRRENLIEFAEQARISQKLVRLEQAVPLDIDLKEMVVRDPNPEKLISFLKDMEFSTLTRRVAAEHDLNADEIEAAGGHPRETGEATKGAKSKTDQAGKTGKSSSGGAPGALLADISPAIDTSAYVTITKADDLQPFIDAAYETGYIAVDTETNSLDPMQARLIGVSLCADVGKACYIPLGHSHGDGLDFDNAAPEQMALKDAIAAIKPVLEDPSILKIGQQIKFDMLVLAQHGIEVAPIDDTMAISYVLDSGLNGHGMDELAQKHLGHTCIPYKEVTGTGRNKITFDLVAIDRATAYAAEDADVTLRLWHVLRPRLIAEHRMTVYQTLDRPLIPVVAAMERAGVKVDREELARLSATFAQKMAELEDDIHDLAGEKFNIGSPKQLGDILFGKMGIPGGKKTKTGAWSTDADTLETLAAQGIELAQRVLDWRGVSKLKSTYTDALPDYINPETGRVHTSYALAATSTGRFASSEPNLQNIPIRTEEGRRIRKAFIAEKGNKLISADYSQIELRLLAHIADIHALKQAFDDGQDIHAITASEIFDTPVDGMDPMVRRQAKAINFGIIYGISAFGLANNLGIPRDEAQAYIKRYFEKFPGIRDYMDRTKEAAHSKGYVETIFGRRIHLPEINSKNPNQRAFMERAAINAPIQGSAADIIRRAMIRMPDALREVKLEVRMLLQVHDELIFEAPEQQAEKACTKIAEVMSKACEPALALSVPLDVEARAGDSWADAH